jgi:hypothetical protein
MAEETREKHESYGVLQLSRHQGPATSLFCSSIKHDNTIRLRVAAAELHRSYNTDRAYSSCMLKDTFVDVEMSYNQFAEAITAINQGAGVPVTVRYANGRKMEPCPFTSKDEQFRAEFNSGLAELAETIDGAVVYAKSLFENKKPLSKSEKEQLLSRLARLSQEVRSNIPFVRDMFAEQMDKTVTEAKSNFEGFVQNRMSAIANAAIAQNLGAMGDGAEVVLTLEGDALHE